MASVDVALGLRAKTARAIVVVLAEGDDGPEVLRREELPLHDPKLAASHQPHHAGLDLPAAEAKRVVGAAERAVHGAANAALRSLMAGLARDGLRPVSAGVVGAPVKDPARIGNPHVRAHAAEGQLFRDTLERAARARRLPFHRLSERSAWDDAAALLRCEATDLRRQIQRLGEPLGPPWRADEKLACLGAWIALLGPRP